MFDSNGSHLSIKVVKAARANQITILKLWENIFWEKILSVASFHSTQMLGLGSLSVASFHSTQMLGLGSLSVASFLSTQMLGLGSLSVASFHSTQMLGLGSLSVASFHSTQMLGLGSLSVVSFHSTQMLGLGSLSVASFHSTQMLCQILALKQQSFSNTMGTTRLLNMIPVPQQPPAVRQHDSAPLSEWSTLSNPATPESSVRPLHTSLKNYFCQKLSPLMEKTAPKQVKKKDMAEKRS